MSEPTTLPVAADHDEEPSWLDEDLPPDPADDTAWYVGE